MCSQDAKAVETVKNELAKAGIVAECRKHPIAEALGVQGMELWVQDERDFFNAAKLYARLQDSKSGNNGLNTVTGTHKLVIDFDEPEIVPAPKPAVPTPDSPKRQPVRALPGESGASKLTEMQQVGLSLLESEIEQMLAREKQLMDERDTLRAQADGLSEALRQEQTALAREKEVRLALEREYAEKSTGFQAALENERAERARLEEEVGRELDTVRQQLSSREASLSATREQLAERSEQLEAEQAAIVDLREEIAARELQRQEHERVMTSLRAELDLERDARASAEAKAQKAVEAQRSLEQQLLDQKELEQRMKSHMAGINSLCTRLQAKRVALAEPSHHSEE